MDDETLAERLNRLGRLAETNVAAGTPDTGKSEITHEEADRIVSGCLEGGASTAQIQRILEGETVFAGYRVVLLRALTWSNGALK